LEEIAIMCIGEYGKCTPKCIYMNEEIVHLSVYMNEENCTPKCIYE